MFNHLLLLIMLIKWNNMQEIVLQTGNTQERITCGGTVGGLGGWGPPSSLQFGPQTLSQRPPPELGSPGVGSEGAVRCSRTSSSLHLRCALFQGRGDRGPCSAPAQGLSGGLQRGWNQAGDWLLPFLMKGEADVAPGLWWAGRRAAQVGPQGKRSPG